MPALLVDRAERVLAANAAAERLLGEGLAGRHVSLFLRQPPVIAAIEASLRDGRPRTARHHADSPAGETVYEVTCRPVRDIPPADGGDSEGALRDGLLLCLRDVSDMRQATEMRRDFVANVSHELRTPLTALMGFIETLRGPARDDPAARERFLAIMEAEAARMNRLVSDLLSLNRVESEERVRPQARVELRGILDSTLRTLAPVAEGAGVVLSLETPDGSDDAVEVPGDADQLRQVFVNLVENAIKYGGSGGRVTVTLTRVDHDPALRGPAVRVAVADRGPGIESHHLPRLTERFYRADAHRSRALGGTGLGLAIVKHIINRHRGRLKIDSRPGEGATFTVSLPANRPG